MTIMLQTKQFLKKVTSILLSFSIAFSGIPQTIFAESVCETENYESAESCTEYLTEETFLTENVSFSETEFCDPTETEASSDLLPTEKETSESKTEETVQTETAASETVETDTETTEAEVSETETDHENFAVQSAPVLSSSASSDSVYNLGNGFQLTLVNNQIYHTSCKNYHPVTSIKVRQNGLGTGDNKNSYLILFTVNYVCRGNERQLPSRFTIPTQDFSCTEAFQRTETDCILTYDITWSFSLTRAATSHASTSNTTSANCKAPQTTTYSSCSTCRRTPETVIVGEKNPNNHIALTSWQQNSDLKTHTRTCSCGYSDTKPCSGGTADCSNLAKCTDCGSRYGSLGSHNLVYFSGRLTSNDSMVPIREKCTVYGCPHVNKATAQLQLKTTDALIYTGSEIKPPVEMVYSDDWLGERKQPSDANLSYLHNISPGNASCTFYYFDGRRDVFSEIYFTIQKKTPSASDFLFTLPEDLCYDGNSKSVSITVKNDIEGMGNLSVTYSQNGQPVSAPVNAGKYSVTLHVTEGAYYTAADITNDDWSFEIEKAPSSVKTAPAAIPDLIYNGEAQSLITAGSTDHGTMQYSLDGGITWSPEVPTKTNAGTYHVNYRIIGDGNYSNLTAKEEITVTISQKEPLVGTVTGSILANSVSASEITFTRTNIPSCTPGSFTVKQKDQKLSWGENLVTYLFTPTDTTNYSSKEGSVIVTVTDTIPPSGTVSIKENYWTKLLNTITFTQFFNTSVDVQVNASDSLSGIASIEYYESEAALDLPALKTLTSWKSLSGEKITVTAQDAKRFVYYIRITDHAGNTAYLSTDGAVFDTQDPLITGITDQTVYYTTQKFDISEINPDIVTVNDTITTEQLLPGNVKTTYVVTAFDKAGNQSSVTVYMKPISDLTKAIETFSDVAVTSAEEEIILGVLENLQALDMKNASSSECKELEDQIAKAEHFKQIIADVKASLRRISNELAAYQETSVTSEDSAALKQLMDDSLYLLAGSNLTEEERQDLESKTERIKALQTIIAQAASAIHTECIQRVKEVTATTVTANNKDDLTNAKTDLEKALDTYSGNYTAAEKQTIQNEIQRMISALEALQKAADLTDAIDQLPAIPGSDILDLAEELPSIKESYENLSDHEKTLISQEHLQKLEAFLTALEKASSSEDEKETNSSSAEDDTPNNNSSTETNPRPSVASSAQQNLAPDTSDHTPIVSWSFSLLGSFLFLLGYTKRKFFKSNKYME